MDKKALCELSGAPEMGQIINTTVLAITVIRGTLGLQSVPPPIGRVQTKQTTGNSTPELAYLPS